MVKFCVFTLMIYLKDSRNLCISAFLVTELGVFPCLSGELGLSVKGAKILTISVCPCHAALQIGVSPELSGALGLPVKKGKKNYCLNRKI